VVIDRASESIEPQRDCLADATQPDDADTRVADLTGQRVVPVDGPTAGAHVAIGGRELPQRAARSCPVPSKRPIRHLVWSTP